MNFNIFGKSQPNNNNNAQEMEQKIQHFASKWSTPLPNPPLGKGRVRDSAGGVSLYFSNLQSAVIEELLRQARLTFNLALGVTAASAMMTLSGVGLLYLNKVPEASLTAGAGLLGSISSVQFAKDAKEELGEMIDKLAE